MQKQKKQNLLNTQKEVLNFQNTSIPLLHYLVLSISRQLFWDVAEDMPLYLKQQAAV